MNYQSKIAAAIMPYTAGEQPKDKKYIKLNTNENPYPPPPEVAKRLQAARYEDLRLYSDPECLSLKKAIAKLHGVTPSNVFVGNGSDEVLAMCFPAFFDADGGGVAFADITYSFYPVYANLFSVPICLLPLSATFEIGVEAYAETGAQGILLANPNAPTSIALSAESVRVLVESNKDKVIIIDEAYAEFSEENCVALAKEYDNVLIVRTFSKSYSLAGARCGYAIGCKNLISTLEKIKNCFNSYTVNSITQMIAAAALSDSRYHERTLLKIKATRAKFCGELTKLGFSTLPAAGNFVFTTHERVPAKFLYTELKQRGILVRYFDKERINNYLRITVGTDEEMDALTAALSDIICTK